MARSTTRDTPRSPLGHRSWHRDHGGDGRGDLRSDELLRRPHRQRAQWLRGSGEGLSLRDERRRLTGGRRIPRQAGPIPVVPRHLRLFAGGADAHLRRRTRQPRHLHDVSRPVLHLRADERRGHHAVHRCLQGHRRRHLRGLMRMAAVTRGQEDHSPAAHTLWRCPTGKRVRRLRVSALLVSCACHIADRSQKAGNGEPVG